MQPPVPENPIGATSAVSPKAEVPFTITGPVPPPPIASPDMTPSPQVVDAPTAEPPPVAGVQTAEPQAPVPQAVAPMEAENPSTQPELSGPPPIVFPSEIAPAATDTNTQAQSAPTTEPTPVDPLAIPNAPIQRGAGYSQFSTAPGITSPTIDPTPSPTPAETFGNKMGSSNLGPDVAKEPNLGALNMPLTEQLTSEEKPENPHTPITNTFMRLDEMLQGAKGNEALTQIILDAAQKIVDGAAQNENIPPGSVQVDSANQANPTSSS